MRKNLILAAQVNTLPEHLLTTGFAAVGHDEVISTLDNANLWLGPRDPLEQLPNFKQIIPYAVFRVGDQFVAYNRAPAGGEERLHGQWSIGFGGHIDLEDVQYFFTRGGIHIAPTLETAVYREVEEELAVLCCEDDFKWVGFVNDAETEVGAVHLGVVTIIELDHKPEPNEDAIRDLKLYTLDELRERRGQFELWSALLIDHMADHLK